ncbi:MAG TPA: hypothetical protein VJ377_06630 [Dehalococcoidales bacterium]|nr:hypothetical protein [Dehalococcoidales bacterium]
MKKVLIIARYFGTRIPGLIKYLPEYKWQPLLLTTDPITRELPPDLPCWNTPYQDLLRFWRRIFGLNPYEDFRTQIRNKFGVASKGSALDPVLTFVSEVINYPDADKGWRHPGIKLGMELLQRENISAIISSSSPVSGHIIARELSGRSQIPWVADLRDLWSQNHNYTYSRFRKILDRRLEIKTLGPASALVTASQPWADRLSELHRGKTTCAITNGFDPADVKGPAPGLTTKFTITHTGNIYEGKQDPTRLFAALRRLISEGTIDPGNIEVRFYGPALVWLDKEVRKYGLSGAVKQHGTVPHDVAIEKQRESQLLLLLDWDAPGENGVYPLKVFEYLGSMRPILATGGTTGNVVDVLLRKTGTGVHAPEAEAIINAIARLYREYRQDGRVTFRGAAGEINRYSQREMTGQFATILDRLSGK